MASSKVVVSDVSFDGVCIVNSILKKEQKVQTIRDWGMSFLQIVQSNFIYWQNF